MNDRVRKGVFACLGTGVLAMTLLAGCGGGSDSSGSSGGPGATPVAASTSIGGTVATGSAVVNAAVQIVDATGKIVNATADSAGRYTASLGGLTAPLLVVATDPAGQRDTLYSVVAVIPTGSAPTIANATTLSTALATLLTASGNPADLGANLKTLVTPDAVSAARSKLNVALASILAANGLTAASFDPVSIQFDANQTGQDAVIDAVHILPASSGGSQLTSVADLTAGIVLNQSTVVNAPLAVPPAPANYLASVTGQLAACLAGTQASCGAAIDSQFRENGYTSFATAHPDAAQSGVTLGTPQTVAFFTDNGVQKSYVAVPFTTTSGKHDNFVTVAQATGSNSWNLVGNQQQYDVVMQSSMARRHYLDADDAPYNRYEAGFSLAVSAGGVNPANLASVAISGPGIDGTAYLLPRNSSGTALFGFASHYQNTVPTGGLTSSSNTSIYRWSWKATSDATQTFTPNSSNLGFYAPTPIDLATVPPLSAYTVTFYDSAGAQIGQPFKVVNTTPALDASTGSSGAWHTLSSGTIASVLTPGGALAGAQRTLPVSWTSLDSNGINNGAQVIQVQVQAVPGSATTPSVDGWWPGPSVSPDANGLYTVTVTAGLDEYNVVQCTNCPFVALETGGSRLVSLTSLRSGVPWEDIWKVYE